MLPVARKNNQSDQNGKDGTILAICMVVLAASLALHLSPTGVHAAKLMDLEIPDVCPVHRFSGFWCPGCGLTRAFIASAHGDILGAFRFNPLGPILFALLLLQIPYRIVRLNSKDSSKDSMKDSRYASVSGGIGDPIMKVLLIALLLLGGWRIEWGLTHMALLRAGQAPPSNWAMSFLLIGVATVLWIVTRLFADRIPAKRTAVPLCPK